ncbi:hypothetical protein BGX21_000365 [Mortierella sp. AD011]|nr:hypothetical protein BGX21_000365 [Mortierella sp. AD011]
MLMNTSLSAAIALACISISAAAGVITVPMTGLVRPEHQNAVSLTKRYLQKRALTSTSPLTSASNDVMYTISLGVGTPPQMFNLAIDTGSPNM